MERGLSQNTPSRESAEIRCSVETEGKGEYQQPGMRLNFQVVITTEIDSALTAVARAFDRDKRDVVREILGDWAARTHVEAKILAETLLPSV